MNTFSKLIEDQITTRLRQLEDRFDSKLKKLTEKHAADLESLTQNIKNEFHSFRAERKIETKETMVIIQQTIQAALSQPQTKVTTSCRPFHDSGEDL